MRLIKRFRKFINKIGSPDRSPLQNFSSFLNFICSPPGLRFVWQKLKLHLLHQRPKDYLAYHKFFLSTNHSGALQQRYDSEKHILQVFPLVSIIMPVYNPKIVFLEQAILSVKNQLYTNWELCIADDVSPNRDVQATIQAFAKADSRIKAIFREVNGHISECTNSALSIATGEYLLFMDHDDLLTQDCLFEVVKAINSLGMLDIIYSDEDKIDLDEHYVEPHFKPDWAPDNLLSRNYMGHVVVARKAIVDAVGGFRTEFDGSQDYDFLLRATEQSKSIYHIPRVLYHWRVHDESVAMAGGEAKPYAYVAAKRAIEEALKRRNTPAIVDYIPNVLGGYRVVYSNVDQSKVSIIIPSKDQAHLLRKSIDSILKYSTNADFEIVLLDNNSVTPEFFALVKEYSLSHPNRFRCVAASFPFNYSKLMNLGARESTGKYLLMLNNDIEVLEPGWLKTLLSFAQRSYTGAVGAKLLYPNGTIQHAGVVLGFGGTAAHVFCNTPRYEPGYFNYLVSLNNYSAVTGACMMCRKSVFNEVGGFDESLQVEYNDIDFCLKLQSKGYYNVYVPDVQLYHHESVTRGHPFHSKKNWERHEHDAQIFKQKWANLIARDPFYNPNLSLHSSQFDLKLYE